MSGVLAVLGGGGAPGVLNASLPSAAGAGSASWALVNDGTATISGSSGIKWVVPATSVIAAYYQVKTVVTAGSFSADPSAGTYIDCSTSRTWNKGVAGTVSFTYTFREKATGIVRASGSASIVVT